ncbi:MAG TPA: hypothetical protein VHU41_14835, partial [Thermoanaerobaculia bacterium]|nr:hypothetical protein [Thermoanaerobaculia bacterium]
MRSLAESMLSMSSGFLQKIGLAALTGTIAACGGSDTAAKTAARPAPVESTTVAASGATAAPASHTDVPRVLFLGTSLTAGLGLDDPTTQAYPAVIQRIADSLKVKMLVVNAGLSG